MPFSSQKIARRQRAARRKRRNKMSFVHSSKDTSSCFACSHWKTRPSERSARQPRQGQGGAVARRFGVFFGDHLCRSQFARIIFGRAPLLRRKPKIVRHSRVLDSYRHRHRSRSGRTTYSVPGPASSITPPTPCKDATAARAPPLLNRPTRAALCCGSGLHAGLKA